MSTVQVRVRFSVGSMDYDLPHVFSITDPQPSIKAVVIDGRRADGAIVIPGGKKSEEIVVRGTIIADDYNAVTDIIDNIRTYITTDVGILSLQHYDPDTTSWISDWSYTVRRIDKIDFSESLRIVDQEYSIRFLILSY